MTSPSLVKTLTQFDIFKDFTPEEVWQILASGQVRQLKAGETLIAKDVSNNMLFLLVEGELRVILEKDGTEISIPIHSGECLGEMSIVMERPTSALAIAHKTSLVLCIPENTFWDQIMMTRKGIRNLMSMMASRQLKTNHALIKEVEEQLKYQLLEKELEAAGNIQSNIVPNGKNLFPNRPEIDAYALINQAREVGGDFYDALVLDEDHIYIAIGDVSGKGMPAALFMMRTFTSLRLLISNNPGFEGVVPSVNNWLAKNNKDMMFASIFAGVLNTQTGVFRYANGGHNPPFVSQKGGNFKLLGLPKGTLVGIQDQSPFPITELKLKPGDTILLYTDGITEAMRADQVMFDVARIRKALNKGNRESMEILVQNLEDAVESFVSNAPQYDDYTIFALQYLGN